MKVNFKESTFLLVVAEKTRELSYLKPLYQVLIEGRNPQNYYNFALKCSLTVPVLFPTFSTDDSKIPISLIIFGIFQNYLIENTNLTLVGWKPEVLASCIWKSKITCSSENGI